MFQQVIVVDVNLLPLGRIWVTHQDGPFYHLYENPWLVSHSPLLLTLGFSTIRENGGAVQFFTIAHWNLNEWVDSSFKPNNLATMS